MVAKLVKSFGAPWEITESLDDFRYDANQYFSVEDVLTLNAGRTTLGHGFHFRQLGHRCITREGR